jgi:hypothetical protein
LFGSVVDPVLRSGDSAHRHLILVEYLTCGRFTIPRNGCCLSKKVIEEGMRSLHNRNLRRTANRHQNRTMWGFRKGAILVLFGVTALGLLRAQDLKPPKSAKDHKSRVHQDQGRFLSLDDRLAVIASALDARTPRSSEHDCSHLVHAIYERAGFPYAYADSDDLHAGVEGFQRISKPDSGDLVVWRGHVGIVIRPSRHVFFSFLNSGPGIDDYTSGYWKGRGQPRFYRYVKNSSCPGCAKAPTLAAQKTHH